MSELDPPRFPDSDDERILRDNLRVAALSADALVRIRRATEAEWRRNFAAPRRRRRMLQAAAAAVAVLAITGTWLFARWGPDTRSAMPLAKLERAAEQGVVEHRFPWRVAAVDIGTVLRGGEEFETRGAALFALRGGGNLRVAAGSRFDVLSANSVRLERGEIYVDIPPGQHADASFVAVTDAGEFHHVGTQFAVTVEDGATRLRVREGRVQWLAVNGESTVGAGTEVLVDRDRGVTRRELDSSGTYWAWIASLAPDFDIENRPLSEFLDWVARETGRKLVIDESARSQVAGIRMHGNVHGLEPLQALKAVMSSTSLRFELPAGAIRVSFAGESPPTLR
jgi:ferric-dicitrate binding protein FerR (iron transport regulator)